MTKWAEWLDKASDNDLALMATGMIQPPKEDEEEEAEDEGQRNWEKWDEEHKVLHPPHPPRDVDELTKLYGDNPRNHFEEYKIPGALDEKGNDVYDMDAERKDRQAWDAKMKRALSMGELSDVEAKSIGFYQPGGEQWHPLPPDLYHVTTNATAVEKSGRLKTRDELNMGLGHGLGGGTSDTISFTEKPETAQTIKDAMLEARSVANGETSVADLVERARKGDKGSTPFLASIMHGMGAPDWKEGDPLTPGLQALIDGKTISSGMMDTVEEFNKDHPSPTTPWKITPSANTFEVPKGLISTHFERDMTPAEKADAALDFYKTFSLWREHHGGPEDPLFFLTDAQALGATKPEDIKVVHVQPKPRAQGFQLSALGEWRTHTGDNVDIVGTRWWAETLLRLDSAELETRDWVTWDEEHRPFGRKHYQKAGDAEAEEAWSRGHHEVFAEHDAAKAVPHGHAPTDREHKASALKEALRSFKPKGKTKREKQLDQAYHEGRAHGHHDKAEISHVEIKGFKGILSMGGFRIEAGQLVLRDWTKWDLEHRPLSHAIQHIHENAARFRAAGGTIEELNGREHGDRLRDIDRTELVELRERLVAANGGKPLPARVQRGFQLAHIAATSGRTDPNITVRVARTKEGHIAAIMASGPVGSGAGHHHHIHLVGSTGITHGAGSALLRESLREAAANKERVSLVPYDEDAAQHWSGNLAAHEDDFGNMGWDPKEVKRLAAA